MEIALFFVKTVSKSWTTNTPERRGEGGGNENGIQGLWA
jgi:hypothetical protein